MTLTGTRRCFGASPWRWGSFARHFFRTVANPFRSGTGHTITAAQIAVAREVLAQREGALADAIVKLETAAHGLTGKALDGYQVAIAALEDMKEGRW